MDLPLSLSLSLSVQNLSKANRIKIRQGTKHNGSRIYRKTRHWLGSLCTCGTHRTLEYDKTKNYNKRKCTQNFGQILPKCENSIPSIRSRVGSCQVSTSPTILDELSDQSPTFFLNPSHFFTFNFSIFY